MECTSLLYAIHNCPLRLMKKVDAEWQLREKEMELRLLQNSNSAECLVCVTKRSPFFSIHNIPGIWDILLYLGYSSVLSGPAIADNRCSWKISFFYVFFFRDHTRFQITSDYGQQDYRIYLISLPFQQSKNPNSWTIYHMIPIIFRPKHRRFVDFKCRAKEEGGQLLHFSDQKTMRRTK